MQSRPVPNDAGELRYPEWFSAFLADRAIRKLSRHTSKGYRQDFEAITALIFEDPAEIADLAPADLTKEAMRAAFAVYADTCRSVDSTVLVDMEHGVRLPVHQRAHEFEPEVAKSLPKGLAATTISELVAVMRIAAHNGVATGLSAIARWSSPRCWRACDPRNWSTPTWATFAPLTTAVSFTSTVRAIKIGEFPSSTP